MWPSRRYPKRFPFSDDVLEIVEEHADDYSAQVRQLVSEIVRNEFDAELDEDPDAFGYTALTLMATCTKHGKEADKLDDTHILFQDEAAPGISIYQKQYGKKTLRGAVRYCYDVDLTPAGVSVYHPQLMERLEPGGGEEDELELTLDI